MSLLLLIALVGFGIYFYRKRKQGGPSAPTINTPPLLDKLVGRFTNPVKGMELTEDEWSQAGIRAEFKTGKCTQEGHTFYAKDVRSITWTELSSLQHQVRIQVEDFHKPVILIYLVGAGVREPFVERLCLAIRKAGGPDLR